MVMMVIVVLRVAVKVGDSAQGKEDGPAHVQRPKVMHRLANQQQDDIRNHRHDQARSCHKLVRVHFPGIVNLCKFHMLIVIERFWLLLRLTLI